MFVDLRRATALCALCLPAFVHAATAVYEIEQMSAVELGTFGGKESVAKDINDHGSIVGWASLSFLDAPHAFLYKNGTMKDIGASLGLLPSRGMGINNLDEVVGYYLEPIELDPITDQRPRPFYWTEGTSLHTLASDDSHGWGAAGYAINDRGQIVGEMTAGPRKCWQPPLVWTHAYVDGAPVFCPHNDFGPVPANDINGSGRIVGSELAWQVIAWTWKDGVKQEVPGDGTPYAFDICLMHAYGINEPGYIVGDYGYCGALWDITTAFIWNGADAHSKNLGTLPGGLRSAAYEINDALFVVGFSEALIAGRSPDGMVRDRAFIWHSHFGMVALPTPPEYSIGTNCRAYSVNNRNAGGLVQAVGYCEKSGNKRAVRWDIKVVAKSLQPPSVK